MRLKISQSDVNIGAFIKHNRKQVHTSPAPQNKTILIYKYIYFFLPLDSEQKDECILFFKTIWGRERLLGDIWVAILKILICLKENKMKGF